MKLYFEGTDFKCLILNAWCKVALSKLKSKKLPTSKNKATTTNRTTTATITATTILDI